jgi:hypothetical protein
MIENTRGTRSEWYVIFNDLINSDRKKNGIKKPEMDEFQVVRIPTKNIITS